MRDMVLTEYDEQKHKASERKCTELIVYKASSWFIKPVDALAFWDDGEKRRINAISLCLTQLSQLISLNKA